MTSHELRQSQFTVKIPRCQTSSCIYLTQSFQEIQSLKHKLSCQSNVKTKITHQFWKAFEIRHQMEVFPKCVENNIKITVTNFQPNLFHQVSKSQVERGLPVQNISPVVHPAVFFSAISEKEKKLTKKNKNMYSNKVTERIKHNHECSLIPETSLQCWTKKT